MPAPSAFFLLDALLACERYFDACAKAWCQGKERTTLNGDPVILADDDITALCVEASHLTHDAIRHCRSIIAAGDQSR